MSSCKEVELKCDSCSSKEGTLHHVYLSSKEFLILCEDCVENVVNPQEELTT